MLKKLNVQICHNCPHELVTGVACDWRPMDECPYIEPTKPKQQRTRLQLVPMPLTNETDAIRSID
ncbi:hypothetical protein [Sedimenticola selenatireducens]|mgnify:CR=1 FL=1|uniref:Uncharacterized protein n=1 Tax=Sedimenticola selenatireducens TaxID=191960 RepID=A0A557SBX4_9GAMM|nr:hypothetical protein [Sedimenticola selenatireducens]TVO74906.1 hypothetical protein FHP88_10470 [Sedimenticola selenatireducens]TVT62442.1 MAG: hypothetical protein FHK78_15035 [Sedimenticola selenatireducens]